MCVSLKLLVAKSPLVILFWYTYDFILSIQSSGVHTTYQAVSLHETTCPFWRKVQNEETQKDVQRWNLLQGKFKMV